MVFMWGALAMSRFDELMRLAKRIEQGWKPTAWELYLSRMAVEHPPVVLPDYEYHGPIDTSAIVLSWPFSTFKHHR